MRTGLEIEEKEVILAVTDGNDGSVDLAMQCF